MIQSIPMWVYFAALPSCIVIGYMDYLLLNRWTKCDKCGWQNNIWYNWILPTFIEIALFFLGILVGMNIK